MKIYTKTGDSGTTSLIGGKRVQKNHPRIEAYGSTDELIAFLALLRDQIISSEVRRIILSIQEELMVVSALLATESVDSNFTLPKLNSESIVKLEKEIDRMEKELPVLKAFLIPGGHPTVSICHIARTVCRRVERNVITLMETDIVNEQILIYFNRLSDYLFVLSRALSADFQCEEIIWKPALNK